MATVMFLELWVILQTVPPMCCNTYTQMAREGLTEFVRCPLKHVKPKGEIQSTRWSFVAAKLRTACLKLQDNSNICALFSYALSTYIFTTYMRQRRSFFMGNPSTQIPSQDWNVLIEDLVVSAKQRTRYDLLHTLLHSITSVRQYPRNTKGLHTHTVVAFF